MKKLLLIGAILALGTTAFAVSNGESYNGSGDGMYENNLTLDNIFTGRAADFGNIRDITSTDNKNGNIGAVNIFRDKKDNWESEATTDITLKVLQPIKIESEVDELYVEAVSGDELQIGDLGFKVKGEGAATITFEFIGPLFEEIPGQGDVKGYGGMYPKQTTQFGGLATIIEYNPILSGSEEEIEVDLAFDLKEVEPGEKEGTIRATAMYQ